jgi:hypothetical protein
MQSFMFALCTQTFANDFIQVKALPSEFRTELIAVIPQTVLWSLESPEDGPEFDLEFQNFGHNPGHDSGVRTQDHRVTQSGRHTYRKSAGQFIHVA